MARVRLLNTGETVDLGGSTRIARWSGRPGGLAWGLLPAECELHRDSTGRLIAAVPGAAVRMYFLFALVLTRDYVQVSAEEAVELMTNMGAGKQAQRLFPQASRSAASIQPTTQTGAWRPPAPPGGYRASGPLTGGPRQTTAVQFFQFVDAILNPDHAAPVNWNSEQSSQELERSANAQPVEPIRPPLPTQRTQTSTDGSFSFGTPAGFGPLSPDKLAYWVGANGPTLATVGEINAQGLPMVISANDRGEVSGLEAGLWRLSTDLSDQFRRSIARKQVALRDGPRACIVAKRHAIVYSISQRENSKEAYSWTSLIADGDRCIEITMNCYPSNESAYMPVWWTVLGTWVWHA